MLLNDDNNYDANILPFAECEITADAHLDSPVFQKSQNNSKSRKRNRSKNWQSNDTTNHGVINVQNTVSYVYFENMEEDDNHVAFIPYTGPCNTMHLGTRLYLPQLIPNTANDLEIDFQRFIENYDKIIQHMTASSNSMTLSVYLRFGISYVLQLNSPSDQTLPLREFIGIRRQGKKLKTSFYTCKGVTSPKRLLTAINALNYHQISSNTYSYDVQLYGAKNNQQTVIHFIFNEQLQCHSIVCRRDHPINFDFIRNKASSRFRSIDDSYSDIFDFRIQLCQVKHLSKTDPIVLNALRGVPIDKILYTDESTQILHVSSKLQKFVKYLKCTRSSSYQNFDEQIVITMGTYEEFQLNNRGQCEPLMKASNTMTIELFDAKATLSGRKLYDVGMWFSSLCRTCVDLPSTIAMKSPNNSCKWFSRIFSSRKNYNKSTKKMNVNQLTTYKAQKSQKSYTSTDLAFVKKILLEENLRNILFDTKEKTTYDKKEVEEIYENIMKGLKTNAAPLANEAMEKVQRAYRLLCEEFSE